MPLLRFTNPMDIPAYQDWDFVVLPARITLRIEDMQDIYSRWNEYYQQNLSTIRKHRELHKEYLRVTELLRQLNEAVANGIDVELDKYCVWPFCSPLMFSKQFLSAICPACNREYGSAECEIQGWGYRSSGGRRVLCPSGHTLYSCTEETYF